MNDLIRQAIDLEQKGWKFYEKMAAESSNELAKALFENLADDEKDHERWIRNWSTDMESQEALTEDEEHFIARTESIEARIKDIFSQQGASSRSAAMDNVEGLDLAMEMEEEAIAMYNDFNDDDLSPKQKRFLEAILKEEQDHLEALRNVHFYLTDTGAWYHEQERWNWMNI